jgi:hypothetical protein
MRVTFRGLPHVQLYQEPGFEAWPIGEVREVSAERAEELRVHGGFELAVHSALPASPVTGDMPEPAARRSRAASKKAAKPDPTSAPDGGAGNAAASGEGGSAGEEG